MCLHSPKLGGSQLQSERNLLVHRAASTYDVQPKMLLCTTV